MKKKRLTIAFATGKSGGHIVPCLTLGQQSLHNDATTRLLFFAADTPLDRSLLEHRTECISYFLKHRAFPGLAFERYPAFLIAFIGNFFTALHMLFYYKTDKVISTGEFIAIPTCLAARLLGIPIELYELNVIPGKTVRFLSRIAEHIYCSFEETQLHFPRHKASYRPYPARYSTKDILPRLQACKALGIKSEKKIILIMGGSQGSIALNRIIKQWLDTRITQHEELHILHQTGKNDLFDWPAYYQEKNIAATIFSYNPDLALLYSAADLIICRSGAGTLFEAIVFEKPIITVPLELPGNDHQLHNALAMAEKYRLIQVLRQHDMSCFKELIRI